MAVITRDARYTAIRKIGSTAMLKVTVLHSQLRGQIARCTVWQSWRPVHFPHWTQFIWLCAHFCV